MPQKNNKSCRNVLSTILFYSHTTHVAEIILMPPTMFDDALNMQGIRLTLRVAYRNDANNTLRPAVDPAAVKKHMHWDLIADESIQ